MSKPTRSTRRSNGKVPKHKQQSIIPPTTMVSNRREKRRQSSMASTANRRVQNRG